MKLNNQAASLNSGHYKITFPALNLNATADNAVVLPFSKWKLTRCDFHDSSTSLAISIAVVGLFTAATGGGSNLVTSAVTGLVVSTDCISQTLAFATKYQTAGMVYLRPTTLHGSAATCDVTIHVDDLS